MRINIIVTFKNKSKKSEKVKKKKKKNEEDKKLLRIAKKEFRKESFSWLKCIMIL